MKLFTRYNRINLFFTVILFIAASVAFYFLLRFVLIQQLDETLEVEQQEIETYAAKYNKLLEAIPVKDQRIEYEPVSEHIEKREFRSLQVYDSVSKEKEATRQLLFPLQINTQWYHASVSKSMEETETMTRSIILITVITILLILLTSLLINRLVLKKLWQPFYSSLNKIQDFSIDQKQQVSFPATDIDEFGFMNKTLQEAIGKAQNDYLLLKEFTENASHELQTPLAIIRSKLDILIQHEALSEHQSQAVHAAGNALQRLSRLNSSLLLLAKIENSQYAVTSFISLKNKLAEKLSDLKELIEDKQLIVSTSLDDVNITINTELADILLNNLLSNAIRYSPVKGHIQVDLTTDHLLVSNTGNNIALDEKLLFSRFYKPGSTGESNGLGLSIIKQICDVSGYPIRYLFKDGKHQFIIMLQKHN